MMELSKICRKHKVNLWVALRAMQRGELDGLRPRRAMVDPATFILWANDVSRKGKRGPEMLRRLGAGWTVEQVAEQFGIKPRSVLRCIERAGLRATQFAADRRHKCHI